MRVKDNEIPRGDGFMELGCIRVGEMVESKNGKPHPVSLDYFKATGKNAPMFHNAYGEKPTQIRIMFFSDNDDRACNEVLEYRVGAHLYSDGDGEILRVWNKDINEYIKISAEEYFEKYKKDLKDAVAERYPGGKWKRVLRVKFLILEPFREGEKKRALNDTKGYWGFITYGSKTSLRLIRDAFDTAKETARGRVAGTVFLMQVKMAESNNPGPKKKYPIVEIAPVYEKKQSEYIMEKMETKLLEG